MFYDRDERILRSISIRLLLLQVRSSPTKKARQRKGDSGEQAQMVLGPGVAKYVGRLLERFRTRLAKNGCPRYGAIATRWVGSECVPEGFNRRGHVSDTAAG